MSDWLACPGCGSPGLIPEPRGLSCPGCGAHHPDLGPLPCLVPEPAAFLEGWRSAVAGFGQMMDRARGRLEQELARPDLLPATRSRIEALRDGGLRNHQAIEALLAAAGLSAASGGHAADAPAAADLTEHYELLHRDWAWDAAGNRENARALAAVLAALGGPASGRKVAVLGAGACRLAYDIHQTAAPELTVAIDTNPLLLLLAHRVIFEGGLRLAEFPPVPDSASQAVIERSLRADAVPRAGLHLLLADATAAPLLPGAFDTLVTPWFVDVAQTDLRDLLGSLHELLPVGGTWVNHGPLIYSAGHSPAQRYAPEEVIELVELAGFRVRERRLERVEHLVSPASAHARLEGVLTFAAEKVAFPPDEPSREPPAWLLLPHLPIPRRVAGPRRPDHPLLAAVAERLDGALSMDDVAELLLEWGAVPPTATPRDAARAVLYQLATRRG